MITAQSHCNASIHQRRLGATMVEYSLLLALVAVVLMLSVWGLSRALKSSFATGTAAVESANRATP